MVLQEIEMRSVQEEYDVQVLSRGLYQNAS